MQIIKFYLFNLKAPDRVVESSAFANLPDEAASKGFKLANLKSKLFKKK